MQMNEDAILFKELELCLGLNNFNFEDVADVSNHNLLILKALKYYSKYGILTRHRAVDGFKRAGAVNTAYPKHSSESKHDLFSKFMITFEKTQG